MTLQDAVGTLHARYDSTDAQAHVVDGGHCLLNILHLSQQRRAARVVAVGNSQLWQRPLLQTTVAVLAEGEAHERWIFDILRLHYIVFQWERLRRWYLSSQARSMAELQAVLPQQEVLQPCAIPNEVELTQLSRQQFRVTTTQPFSFVSNAIASPVRRLQVLFHALFHPRVDVCKGLYLDVVAEQSSCADDAAATLLQPVSGHIANVLFVRRARLREPVGVIRLFMGEVLLITARSSIVIALLIRLGR